MTSYRKIDRERIRPGMLALAEMELSGQRGQRLWCAVQVIDVWPGRVEVTPLGSVVAGGNESVILRDTGDGVQLYEAEARR